MEPDEPAVTNHVRFVGRDRSGTARTGAVEALDVADFVESRFRQGWRELTVHDRTGVEMGAIGRHPDTGRRTWHGVTQGGAVAGERPAHLAEHRIVESGTRTTTPSGLSTVRTWVPGRPGAS